MRSDLGSALLVVMGAAAVLFITAAAVVGIVVFQQTQQARAQAVVRSTALAQQGMEVYLTNLRTDSDFWVTTPTIAGIGQDGTWTVAANIASSTITAVGHDGASGVLHVIRAEVRNETYADYTIATDTTITLGNGAGDIDISGVVRSNSSVILAQDFPGLSAQYFSGGVVNSQYAELGTERVVAPFDFDRMASTFPNLYTAARMRDSWVSGATGVEALYVTGPLAFFRDPNNPAANYWGPSRPMDGPPSSSNVTDLVGVGVDFDNYSNPATGVFYIRSVWAPPVSTSATDKATVTKRQFIELARQDPQWNIGRKGDLSYPGRTLSITPAGLNPNGNNVIYVAGPSGNSDLDVYVKGTYSRSVTIVSERDIYIIGDVKRAADTTATLGLVAKGNIYICGGMPDQQEDATYQTRDGSVNGYSDKTYLRGSADPKTYGEILSNNVTIQASLMAIDGAIIMDPEDLTAVPDTMRPPKRPGTLTIQGSLTARLGLRGPNFANEYDAQYGGFARTVIGPDSVLQLSPPPLFPQTGNGALKVRSWDEYTTDVDPNAGLTFPPPGVYGPTGPVIDDGEELVVIIPAGGDGVPPTTDANIPAAGAIFSGQAVITLDVSDTSDNGNSAAIWKTWYRIDADPTVYVGKTIVLPPLPDNTVATRTVTYWSQDMAGNMEPEHTITFVMRGRDTLSAFTTVTDSQNPTKDLPDGYPQTGDADYVVYGEFMPQFASQDPTSGLGVEQIWVIRDGNEVTIFDRDRLATVGDKTMTEPLPALEPPVAGFATRTYEYYSIDKAGNREAMKRLTIKQHAFDKIAPITYHDMAVNPITGSALYVGNAKITLTARDDEQGQGVRETLYQIDGGVWVRSENPTETLTFITTLTVAAPARGQEPISHTMNYYSTDRAWTYGRELHANAEEIQTVDFVVGPPLDNDVTAPETTSDAQPTYIGPAVITLRSTDAGGLDKVYWRLDGGPQQIGTRIEIDSPWSGEASHTLEFWAVDLSGNEEGHHIAAFTITPERTAPITSAHNLDLYAGPAVFQLTAEDNVGGSGLAGTYYKIDDGPYELGVTTPLGLTWVTVTEDGLHTVTFYSVDHAGNAEVAKSCELRIDTIAPTTSSDASLTTYTGAAVVSLTANDGGSGVDYTHWRNMADGVEQVSNPVLLGPGTWDVQFWSVDKAGNAETPKMFRVTVIAAPDVTAPDSYDDIKAYYKAGSNPPAIINLYSWDVQSGVDTMNYILDGVVQTQFPGTGNPPASYQFPVSAEGTHTVEYWAVDKVGNVETPHHIRSFKVDITLPVTSCSARAGATYWATQIFTLQGSDAGSGLKATYYSLDGGVTIKGTTVYVPAPLDGFAHPHIIQFWSVDNAGNIEVAKSVSFTSKPLDDIAPTTTSNAVPAYQGSAIISLTARDNYGGSGVAWTKYRLDNGPEITVNKGAGETTPTNIPVAGSGSHTLEFWSGDNAGMLELPHKNVTYVVDSLAPTTLSDARALYNTPAVIHLTAADAADGSSVANTYYRIDGGAIATGTPPVTTVSINTTGSHTLAFWSVDVAGNAEATKTVTFKIDMTPPRTTSDAAADYAGQADFTLTSVDETGGSGVAHTFYKKDNGARIEGTAVHVDGPASGAPVAHSVTFWSDDAAGNVEDPPTTVSFTVSPLAPMTFSGMSPAEGSTINYRNPTVSVIGHATVSTVTSATARLDGVKYPVTVTYGGGYWVNQGYQVDGYWAGGYYEYYGCSSWWVAPYWVDGYWVDTSYYMAVDYATATVSFPVVGLANGQHWASVTFTNALGATNTKTWNFTVTAPADVTAPVTTSNAAAMYANTATITLSAVDETGGMGVAATYYKLDNGSQQTGTAPTTTVVVSAEGTHTLEFWSADKATPGNVETPHKTIAFIVDKTAPTTTLGAIASFAGTATVYLSARDNAGGSGVNHTTYKVDAGTAALAATGVPGAIGLWHFDEGTGATSADSSGGGLTGSLVIGAGGTQTTAAQAWTNGAAGRFGKSLKFDGVDDYVNLGSTAVLNNLGDRFSVAAWVKSSVNTGLQIIASRSNDWVLQKSGNAYQFSMWNDVTSYTISSINASTDWVYVVATYDSAAGSMNLYINGTLVATQSCTGPTRKTKTANQIGNGNMWHTGGAYYNDYYWNGQIDEVAFSNVARTAGDIQSYYAASTGGDLPPKPVSVVAPVSGPAVSHTIAYSSADNAGNTETTKSASFSVSIPADTTPPTTTHNAVASYLRPTTITLTAVDNPGGWGVAYTRYQLDSTSGAWATGTAAPTGGAGTHTLFFYSVDGAGNPEVVKSTPPFTVASDNTPPVTTSNAVATYSGPNTITLTATDGTGWGVDKTYFRVDGGLVQTGSSVTVTAPANLTPVPHTLDFWSVDLANNKETTKSVSYSVTGIPATMVFTGISPAEDAVITNANPTVTITGDSAVNILGASATLDGVGQPFTITYGGGYWVDNGYWAYEWVWEGCDTWEDWVWHPVQTWVPVDQTIGTVTFPTAGLSNGPHTVSVTYNLDSATQSQGRKTWSFIIDTLAPTTTTNVLPSYTGTATITLTATDNSGGSGIKWTKYRVDTGPDTTGTVIVVPPPAYGTTTHTIYYWSSDNMNNVEAVNSASFNQSANPDTTPPTTTSNAATSYPAPSTITLTAVDNPGGWGVANTFYRLDSGAVTTGTAPVTNVGTSVAGTHTLEFWSVDRANNAESPHKSVTYTVAPDTTPPTTTSNAAASYTGPASITLTAVDNPGGWGVKNTYYRLDDAATQTASALTVQPPLLGGVVHHIDFWSDDKADNVEAVKTATFTLNAAPASIAFSGWTPPNNSGNRGVVATASVLGTANQPISSASATINGSSRPIVLTFPYTTTGSTQVWVVSSVWIVTGGHWEYEGCGSWYVEEGYWQDTSHYETQTASVTDYTRALATISTGGLTDGFYTAQVQMVVENGTGNSTNWSFWVDNVAPTTSTNATGTYTGSAPITLSATDATGSGVASTWHRVDSGAYVQGTSFSVPAPTYGSGAHRIDFYSIDRAGNTEVAKSVDITVTANYDGTAPTSTDNVQRWYRSISTITLTPYDAGWGILYTKYQLVKNGVAWPETTYTAPFPTGDGEGNYVLYYWSVDRATNRETTRTAIFGVDMTPPVTTSDAIATYSMNATISLTATDNLSGVSLTNYTVDDGVLRTGTLISVPGPAAGSAVHHIDFYSRDVAGNQESQKTATFTITATPASIVWSAWTPGKLATVGVRNPTVSVRGKATANVTGVTATLDGVAKTPVTITNPSVTTTSNVWVTSGYYGAGTPEWIAGYWVEGHYEYYGCSSWWVDTYWQDGYWYTPTVWIDTSHYEVQSSTFTDLTDATASFTTSNLTDGVHTVVFTYTVSGGAQGSETWTFVVAGPDNTAPVTTHDAVASYVGTATIHLTATDNVGGSGVRSTYYKLDGSAPFSATGGTQYTSGANTVIVFTGSGNLVCTGSLTGANVLVVGGGGGGGGGSGAGAGGGGFIGSTVNLSGTMPVTIGAGGAGGAGTAARGANGGNSVFGGLTAIGGGGGGFNFASGLAGGSGGGGNPAGGYTAGQGFAGGADGTWSGFYPSGGGGGAGAAGGAGSGTTVAGNGGAGKVSAISGTSTYYGGGGGGGTYMGGTLGTGGIGGGGNGGGFNGTVNTGGGAGGGKNNQATAAGVGGSGIVIISYPTAQGFLNGTPPVTTVTVAPPVNGSPVSHTLYFYSDDNNNNTEAPVKSVTFTVAPRPDSTPPNTASSVVPTYTGSATISLTASDNAGGWGLKNIYYRLDSGSQVTYSTPFTVPGPVAFSQAHTLEFWSDDLANNVETPHKFANFTILANPDSTAPTTTHNASTVYAGPSTITLTPVDNSGGWGIDYTRYRLDVNGVTGTVTTYTAAIPTGSQGAYVLNFWSRDKSGNQEATKTAAYVVDQTAPTTTSNALPTYSVTANISLVATDNHVGRSGVQYTYYKIDSGSYVQGTSITVAGPASGPPVAHTISFYSRDFAGWTETPVKTAAFTVSGPPDTTAPTTTSNRVPFYAGPSTITLTPVDNSGGWGVASTAFSVDGGVAASGTAVPTGGQGQHTLEFWSVDNAGNVETPHKTTTYTVDTIAPTTTSDAVASYTGPAIVALTAADDAIGSGLQYTYFKIDNGTQQSAAAPSDLVGLWHFDEIAGTTAVDSSALHNAATLYNSATHVAGKFSNGLGLSSASAQYAYAYTAGTFGLTGQLTVGAWFKSTSTLNGLSLISSSGSKYGIAVNANGSNQSIAGSVRTTSGTQNVSGSRPGNAPLNDGQWHHVAITYDKTLSSARVKLFIDGVLSGQADGLAEDIRVYSDGIYFGSGFDGQIDEALLANTAHSAAEIQKYYTTANSTGVLPMLVSVAPPLFGSANHTITFWSVDNMNNTESQKSATFTVNAVGDTWPPVTTPTWQATYSRPGTITLNATDIGWGVQGIYYSLDNGPTQTGYHTGTGGVMSASCQVGTGLGGPHTLEYWATDQASPTNTESHHTISYTVTSDTTPPVTTSNAVSFYTGPATISLTATDNGGWGVQYTHYRLDGGVETSGTVITVPDTLTGSVAHSIQFWSKDWANNTETAHTATFTVKATPATMSFRNVTPADGSTVSLGNPLIQIGATSNQNISSAAMTVDGAAKSPTVTLSGMNGTATLNATGLTNGVHTVEVTFTCADGRQNSKTWSFSVAVQTDFIAPTTLSNTVASYFGTATIALVATDNAGGTGVAYTKYKVDSGAWTTGTLVSVAGPVTGGPVGHTLYYYSVDNASTPNVEATQSVTFTISPRDLNPPTTTSNAALTYKAPSTILLQASDDQYGTGVAHTYFILDGAAQTEGTVIGTGGQGTHVLEFWSVDYAGNIESPHKFATYKVDVTPPVTQSDAVANYTGTATIHLTASDSGGSGLKSTYYIVDTGSQVAGSVITVLPPPSGSAQHTVYFWSTDNAGNVETTNSATFNVAAPPDTTPPTTTSDAKTTYAVPGLITLTAIDGGWGVDKTFYKLDNGSQQEGLKIRTGGAGTHTLEFWSVDKGNNVEDHHTISYTVTAADTSPPFTTSNAVPSYIGSATISLTATDNCGVLPVTYYKVDSGVVATGTLVKVPGPKSGTASHTLYFWSIDLNGLVETTRTANFTVQVQPAGMTFSNVTPADGSTVLVRNPVLTVTAQGTQTIADVIFELDNVVVTPTTFTLNGNQASLSYNASALGTPGTHSASAQFFDVNGASSTKTWTFTVDAPVDVTPPVTTTDGMATYRGSAVIRFVATDDAAGSGVAATYYKIDGGSPFTSTLTTTTVTVHAAGPHSIEYWSVDHSNNMEYPHKTLSFNIDVTPPVTTSDALDAYAGTAVIHLTADDGVGGSGIAATHYTVDDGPQQTGNMVTIPAPATNSVWHTVRFWSVDNAGNAEVVSEVTNRVDTNVWALSDNTAPVTTFDAQTTYTVPGVIHLSATDNGGWGVAHTYYRLDGGSQVEATILGTGGAGSHTLVYWSIDLNNNVENQHTVTYTVAGNDTVAPNTASNALASYSGTAMISLTASDNAGGSGVAHTYYRLDGGAQTESTLIAVSAAGAHTLQFWSVDWAGNTESVKTANFTIVQTDATPPVTTSNALASYAGTATVSLSATDTGGSGVRTTFYRVDSGPVQQGLSVIVAPPASGAPVSHTIVFWSADNAGNTEVENSVTFAVGPPADTVAPNTTHNGVASYTGQAVITLTANDNVGGSGILATYYRLDGGAQQTGTVITIPAPPSNPAAHTIQFWSRDIAGNTEVMKSFSFTVNPVIITGNATLSFRWDAEDYAEARLHVETASGTWIASTELSGYGGDLYWDVTVPAGQNYYMVCDYYWDDYYWNEGGGYGQWSYDLPPLHNPLQGNDQVVWWY